jgi:hypothetical protein
MEIKTKQVFKPIFFLICFFVAGFSEALAEGVPPMPVPEVVLDSQSSEDQVAIPIKPETEEVLPPKKVVKTQAPDRLPLGTGLTEPLRFMHHGRHDKIERQVGPGTPKFVRERFAPQTSPAPR